MAEHIASRSAAWRRASSIVLIVAATVVLGVAACDTNSGSAPTGDSELPVPATPPPSDLPSSTSAESASAAPEKPTAQTCDSKTLEGPSEAPANAVPVSTDQNLADVVKAHGANTTYWLSPGTHRLGTGAYDQVVPHAGDTFVGAPGAILDGGHKNRYAFAGNAPDVTISFLTVQNFGSRGEQQRGRCQPRLREGLDSGKEHSSEERRRGHHARLG